MLVPALVTLDTQESVFEPPAAQVRLEFLAHKTGQRCTALTKMGEQSLSVLLDNPVEQ